MPDSCYRNNRGLYTLNAGNFMVHPRKSTETRCYADYYSSIHAVLFMSQRQITTTLTANEYQATRQTNGNIKDSLSLGLMPTTILRPILRPGDRASDST